MLSLKTESREALTTYSPQRLLRQFGFIQGVVLVLGSPCVGVWEAEYRYTSTGRDTLSVDFDLIFWPSKSREGVLSAGGVLYWLRCLKAFGQFVAPKSPDPTLLSPVVLIPARDPYPMHTIVVNMVFEG